MIEVLVSITVIAVLLSITLTAIHGVRRGARFAQCSASLRTVFDVGVLFAQDQNRGRWANAFEPGTGLRTWTSGETMWVTVNTIDQTDQWTGPLVLEGYLDRYLDGLRSQGCPEVIRRLRNEPELNPQGQLHLSYHYSAALFTASELWDPDRPERRRSPDDFRRSVGLHEVVQPARLVAFFETGDHHGSGRFFHQFHEPGQGRSQVAFCDGHVASHDPYLTPSLSLPWETRAAAAIPFRGAMPFSATEWGYRGKSVP